MKRLVSGNEAIFQGAIRAGARYFAGYPISPASEILQQAAAHAEEDSNFRFLQAEDEIAAAIATISAALSGVKAFTATSGPGFSLMQEALGWGHVVEAPCVFVNSMRVGPSTGMPTQPAQSDLLQIKGGSSGDYLSHRPLSQFGRGIFSSDGHGLQRRRGIPLTGHSPL